MQYRRIGKTAMEVSALSFGASSLGGVFHSIKEQEAIEAVYGHRLRNEFHRCIALLWTL